MVNFVRKKGIMFNLFRKLLGQEVGQNDATSDLPKKVLPGEEKCQISSGEALRQAESPGNGGKKIPVADSSRAHSFVCREPVLDRDERIAGYEFILPERVQARLQGGCDLNSLRKAYDDALLHNLSSLGSNAVLGSRLSFVRLSPASLDNPLIDRLPLTNSVLMLSPSRQMPATAILQPRLDALRQQGFACGWLLSKLRLEETPDLLTLAANADYVQLEIMGFNGIEIESLLKKMHELRPAKQPSFQLMASELGSFDEYQLFFKGGFNFFLGPFVNSSDNWHPPKSNINRMHVIELLNMLRGGAEFDVIAQQLKLDPVLTFKLLRYLNSPVMSLQSPVTTMDKALMVLGRERFSRWLSLFLFDIKAPGYRDRLLTERALARAHFLESLAGKGSFPAHKDQFFMLGLFSQLDLLMGQSMSDMLRQAKLSEPVQQALLGQPGVYADALALAVAAEGLSPEDFEVKALAYDLDALLVSRSAIEALDWAHEVSALGEG
jgi:EAL and modified HD-GYP domain-containing signal transduction protein